MKFSELFDLLEPALRAAPGSEVAEYAQVSDERRTRRADAFRTLIAKFTGPYKTKDGRELDLAAQYTDESAQNYLSGSKPLSESFVLKVLSAVEPEPLIILLEDDTPGPIRDALIDGLQQYGVTATPDDLGEVVCRQLTEILAARVTRRTTKNLRVIEESKRRVAKAVAQHELKQRIPALITASQGQCLYPGCIRTLAEKPPDANAVCVAVPLLIDPDLDDFSDANVVVLCPTHASVHEQSPNPDAMRHIRESLDAIARETKARQQAGSIPLSQELHVLIGFVEEVSTNYECEYDPNFDAVELRKKIPTTYQQILSKARSVMATYYTQVEDLYREHLAEGKANWRKHAHALNSQFRACEESGMNQHEIFSFLVDFLTDGAHVSRETAEIVVCYFIQKCEVFDEIA